MVLTIYADMLVAVNLYIDFFLLWCVRKVLGLGARTRRLLLGAFLGAVWALLSLLPLPAWAALPLGLGGALLAALGAFMGSRISWFAFHWPAGPAALMTAGLFVICLTVPFLACRRGR